MGRGLATGDFDNGGDTDMPWVANGNLGGSSYCSAHDPGLLFGLGASEMVDQVEIRWPSGAVTRMAKLSARRYYRVIEPAEARKPPPGPRKPSASP